jgi:hypothetical protein
LWQQEAGGFRRHAEKEKDDASSNFSASVQRNAGNNFVGMQQEGTGPRSASGNGWVNGT